MDRGRAAAKNVIMFRIAPHTARNYPAPGVNGAEVEVEKFGLRAL